MKALVLGARPFPLTAADTTYYADYAAFFKRAAETASAPIDVSYAFIEDLIIEVGDGSFSIFNTRDNLDLTAYGMLFLRGDAFRSVMDAIATVSIYARAHNIAVINDYSNARDSSKLLQAVLMHEAGLPVSRTLFVTQGLLDTFDTQNVVFPAILKAVHGSHGNSNYLVHSLQEIQTILADSPQTRFVLQRFVPNDGDFRIVIAGDHSLVIRRIASDGSHLNNTSQGGTAELIDPVMLPANLMRDARRASLAMAMTIGGVDAIIDREDGSYYFLEVNAQPQLMTGAFLNEKERLIGAMMNDIANSITNEETA